MELFSRWFARVRAGSATHWTIAFLLAAVAMGVWAVPSSGKPRQPAEAHWVAGWAAAPVDFRELMANPAAASLGGPGKHIFQGQSLRQLVRPALDGERVRVRFSNRFGKTPLHIGAASVGLVTGEGTLSPATLGALRFGGRPSLTIAPGGDAWSDGIDLKVEAGQAVAVSTFLDQPTPFSTVYLHGPGTSWVASGNGTATPKLQGAMPLALNHIVTGLDVLATQPVRIVVAFGDSITAGSNEESGGSSYPEMLATRLRDSPQVPGALSVLNMGIGGNRLLLDGSGPSGMSRFAKDALAQSGVTHAIVLMGTNDIGRSAFPGALAGLLTTSEPPTAERITEGLEQLIKQARAKGVKVMIGTVPPFRNTPYWTEATEAMRGAVNRWIRARQDVDGVIDFDAILRDPADPLALNPKYDSGDHLHPGKAGHAAMAQAIDLKELLE